ncbi:SRPBCC family protein [Agrococcus baldri]|uniref:Cyclase n=1 Tax=Agrococcus baldri TaxID=153730 RepID=A0AA87RIZ9_9MICO|nr:SRPBCC family protein [Agrococcus baldri]GEK80238.1 cyclase [Agrococcus baldri]
MLQVDERLEIEAPRAEVFRMWTSFAQFPSFMTGIESVHLETEVRMRWRVSIAGVEPVFYAVITEHVPDERIAWVSVDQTTMGWWIDLEELGPMRTRVTLRVIWSPRGDTSWPAGSRMLDARTISCDLQHFRALVEGATAQAA